VASRQALLALAFQQTESRLQHGDVLGGPMSGQD